MQYGDGSIAHLKVANKIGLKSSHYKKNVITMYQEFILVFIVIFCMNNREPTFAQPCVFFSEEKSNTCYIKY